MHDGYFFKKPVRTPWGVFPWGVHPSSTLSSMMPASAMPIRERLDDFIMLP
jgi:hypothetical protein